MDETAYIDMEGVQGIPALSPTHALIGIALSQKEFGTMDYSLSQLCDLLRWSRRKIRAVQTGCYHLTLYDLLQLSEVFEAPLENVIYGRY